MSRMTSPKVPPRKPSATAATSFFDYEAVDLRVQRRVHQQVKELKAKGLKGKALEEAIDKMPFR